MQVGLRPLLDWLVVRVEPLPTMRGSILLPQGDNVRTATVLAVGPGKRDSAGVRIPVGVEVGEKVAYFRWHEEHKSGKKLMSTLSELGDDLAMVRALDVLFVWSGEESIQVTT